MGIIKQTWHLTGPFALIGAALDVDSSCEFVVLARAQQPYCVSWNWYFGAVPIITGHFEIDNELSPFRTAARLTPSKIAALLRSTLGLMIGEA